MLTHWVLTSRKTIHWIVLLGRVLVSTIKEDIFICSLLWYLGYWEFLEPLQSNALPLGFSASELRAKVCMRNKWNLCSIQPQTR